MNRYFIAGRRKALIATPVKVCSKGMTVRKVDGTTMLISWGTFRGVAAYYGA